MPRPYQIRKDEVEKKLISYFQAQAISNPVITLSIGSIAQIIEEKKDRVFRGIKYLEQKGLLDVLSTQSKIKSYRWLGSKEISSSFIARKENNLLDDLSSVFAFYRERIELLEKENAELKKQINETDYEIISTQKLPGDIIVIYRKELRKPCQYHIDQSGNVLNSNELKIHNEQIEQA